jgi:hypothetical protein
MEWDVHGCNPGGRCGSWRLERQRAFVDYDNDGYLIYAVRATSIFTIQLNRDAFNLGR